MPSAFLLSFLLLLPGLVRASESHCEDATVGKTGRAHSSQPRRYDLLHTLHALWMGLCAKVTRKEFTTDQADAAFAYVRRAVLERRREYNTDKEGKPKM